MSLRAQRAWRSKIVFEDDDILVLDKPPGVLVHPTMANEKNTLVDFLLMRYPQLEKLAWPDKARVGVVHRLDKDTSGVIVMAKTPEALQKLQTQFQSREVRKIYLVLVLGGIEESGEINSQITRGEAGLQKALDAAYSFGPKTRPALTLYKPVDRYRYKDNDLTLVQVEPKTGRMHQIRVHLKYIDHPVIGDPLYNTKASRKISKDLQITRQFLHAAKLTFTHPQSGKKISFESKLPSDLTSILDKIR